MDASYLDRRLLDGVCLCLQFQPDAWWRTHAPSADGITIRAHNATILNRQYLDEASSYLYYIYFIRVMYHIDTWLGYCVSICLGDRSTSRICILHMQY